MASGTTESLSCFRLVCMLNDVADMVGTSSKEIRKTYRHWIKEAEDRLDEVQREARLGGAGRKWQRDRIAKS